MMPIFMGFLWFWYRFIDLNEIFKMAQKSLKSDKYWYYSRTKNFYVMVLLYSERNIIWKCGLPSAVLLMDSEAVAAALDMELAAVVAYGFALSYTSRFKT